MRAIFYSVETQAGDQWVAGMTFRTLVAARRWAKRWTPARIIRHQNHKRTEVQ